LGQFIALRHDVNLQTRAVRSQQELNSETLRQFGQALEAVQKSQQQEAERVESLQDEELRPLLKTVVDVADALGLAQRELEKAQSGVGATFEKIVALLAPTVSVPEAAIESSESIWQRWFGSSAARQKREASGRSSNQELQESTQLLAQRVRKQLESVVTGYN